MDLKTRQIRGPLYYLACPQRVLAKIDGKIANKWSKHTIKVVKIDVTFSRPYSEGVTFSRPYSEGVCFVQRENSWYTFRKKILKMDNNSAKNSSKSKN